MADDPGTRTQPDVTRPAAGRGDFWFRLFNHATLALAGVCLVHGEAYFLPLLPWCLLPYLVLLVAAFRAEGRWVLPAWGANVAGVLIVVGIALWARAQPAGPGDIKGLPIPVRMVPYAGPFLMALLTVQLFRPRGPNDFWLLQGMGLLQVALGCVLASGALFGLLMAVYLACALGCLVLHYLAAPDTVGPPPSWRWVLGFVARFSLAVGAGALVVFLVTPRNSGPVWDPFQRFGSRPRTQRWGGGGAFQGANLNGTLPVELSREEAFTVTALTPGEEHAVGPKLDLSLNTRFRCLVLNTYADGFWPFDPGTVKRFLQQHSWDRLPDLGPGQYFLNFDVRPDLAGGLVLAEPVRLGSGNNSPRLPVRLLDFSQPHTALFAEEPSTGVLEPQRNPRWKRYHYQQVVQPGPDPDRVPAVFTSDGYVQVLTEQSVPGLETWTQALLRRLATNPRFSLPAAALVPDPRWPDKAFRVPKAHWERVARVLCKYLQSSGDYTYSLEQRRKDLTLDPVEDFLINVKEGHCERFATALVLMLRTQGIPARMIKGYRGAEPAGNGTYVVRQNMAHAWAEVLVERVPGTAGPPHDWLTLDPSPDAESARNPSPVAEWWKDKTSAGADVWQQLIVGYNADRQANMLGVVSPESVYGQVALNALLYPAPVVAGMALVGGFVWLRARAVRRRRAPGRAAGLACYNRLVRLLARRGGLRRRAWQTPRELATAAAAALAGRPATAALADLPGRIVDLFYRVRFGGEPADAAEVGRLNARLDELARALRRPGGLTPTGAAG